MQKQMAYTWSECMNKGMKNWLIFYLIYAVGFCANSTTQIKYFEVSG
jgi:hypothetical protein